MRLELMKLLFKTIVTSGFLLTLLMAWYTLPSLFQTNQNNTTDVPGSESTYDASLLPNSHLSTVQLLNNHTYTVGEKVKVLITLYDAHGRPRRSGGDVLRVWLRDEAKLANVAGTVSDNADGTYIGEVLLPWRGRPTIIVSIAVPSEITSLVLDTIKHNTGIFFPIKGVFVNGLRREVTLCGPLPPDKKINFCNFTEENYNMEWYCIPPHDQGLRCTDWTKTTPDRLHNGLTKTDIGFVGNNTYKQLRTTLTINVQGANKIMRTSTVSCVTVPKETTWNKRPTGFYFNGTWQSSVCMLPNVDKSLQKYSRCLRARHVILIGDSNIRSFARALTHSFNLKVHRGKTTKSSDFIFANNKKRRLSLSYFPHQLPYLLPGIHEKYLFIAPTKRLDDIPAGNNSIVVLHIWLHAQIMDVDPFRRHVRQIRKSAERLLQRSPHVDLFIKGPHAVMDRNHMPPPDYIASKHQTIWFEEFHGLHNKVIYLEEWDRTVGNENSNKHPSCLSDMINTFLAYIC